MKAGFERARQSTAAISAGAASMRSKPAAALRPYSRSPGSQSEIRRRRDTGAAGSARRRAAKGAVVIRPDAARMHAEFQHGYTATGSGAQPVMRTVQRPFVMARRQIVSAERLSSRTRSGASRR